MLGTQSVEILIKWHAGRRASILAGNQDAAVAVK